MSERPPGPEIYGILAEFGDVNELVTACREVYGAGYREIDAFTPYPVEEVSEAIGFHHNRLPTIVLGGGITGLVCGLGLQYWVSAIAYPVNVGGRPYFSLPAFIPVTFEMTVLFAALAAVLGMLALNGLPQPYHPVFNVPSFALASRDRFFLVVEATDPLFDRKRTADFLERFRPLSVTEVDP